MQLLMTTIPLKRLKLRFLLQLSLFLLALLWHLLIIGIMLILINNTPISTYKNLKNVLNFMTYLLMILLEVVIHTKCIINLKEVKVTNDVVETIRDTKDNFVSLIVFLFPHT